MQEKIVPQPTLRTAADYEAAIEQCLAEMQRLREQMQRDQVEIDRLKSETRAILAQIQRVWARRDLPVRVTSLNEQGDERDLEDTTPAERLGMMWPLAVDAWAFMGEPVAESRLPRHIVRVLRREG